MIQAAEVALTSEHFAGSGDGFLNVAVDWVGRWALLHDLNDWETMLEAARNDGLEEDEVAAALDIVIAAEQFVKPLDLRNIK